MTKKAMLFIMAVGLLLWVQGVSAKEKKVKPKEGEKQTAKANTQAQQKQAVRQSRRKQMQGRNNRKGSQKQVVEQKRRQQSSPGATGMKKRAGNKAAPMRQRGFRSQNLKKGSQNKNRQQMRNSGREMDRFPKQMRMRRQRGFQPRRMSGQRHKRMWQSAGEGRQGNWQRGMSQQRMGGRRHKRMWQSAGEDRQGNWQRGMPQRRMGMGGRRFGRMHHAEQISMERGPRAWTRRGRRR